MSPWLVALLVWIKNICPYGQILRYYPNIHLKRLLFLNFYWKDEMTFVLQGLNIYTRYSFINAKIAYTKTTQE